MLRILINAYACSPSMGSEPGMAWNWCVNLAKYCELEIITEGEFRDNIEKVVSTLPQGKNMHFHYNPVSDEIRRMCWNQGDWRFYKHYKKWQWKTYLIAKQISKDSRIDILHQLNMIGFREPGYLWKLSKEENIPFIWGPVDAKDRFPVAYLQGATLKQKCFIRLKNLISVLQLKHSPRVRKAADQASVIFAASGNSKHSFKKYLHKDVILMNETGCSPFISRSKTRNQSSTFNVLWVGKMDFRKQLGIALCSIANCDNSNIKLHIVGGEDSSPYKKLSEDLGINKQCIWYGAVSHDKVQNLMSECDLLLFTSVAEGTPHVVLEAISNGLPVVCFDTCGQGDIVNDTVGIKIPLTNPHQSAKDFAKCLNKMFHDRDKLDCLAEGCSQLSSKLSWDSKAREVIKIYNKVSNPINQKDNE